MSKKKDREKMITNFFDLHNKGYSYSEIADIHGISKGAVAGIMYRHKNPTVHTEYNNLHYIGVTLPNPNMKFQLKAAAEKEGVSLSAICVQLLTIGYNQRYGTQSLLSAGDKK